MIKTRQPDIITPFMSPFVFPESSDSAMAKISLAADAPIMLLRKSGGTQDCP
ncbi:Uncharacterized protein dnm_033410 [Desulfonema magnum]|uniref:Uncharacterized protein n=1 Tax=Desulfonema magnum TaxID=45655 RepID=A0A975GMU8_9BACT|nr:Uncharacterized protein dnm_033410 [Desulfonema magnum]